MRPLCARPMSPWRSEGAPPPSPTCARKRSSRPRCSAGADAIHPGYGFLAENAGFAAAVIAAGLTWIGPPPDAIAAMGSKTEARDRMAAAGVPVLPGARVDGAAELAALADGVGFPLLVKASAGGGGRGMRLVEDPVALAERGRVRTAGGGQRVR